MICPWKQRKRRKSVEKRSTYSGESFNKLFKNIEHYNNKIIWIKGFEELDELKPKKKLNALNF